MARYSTSILQAVLTVLIAAVSTYPEQVAADVRTGDDFGSHALDKSLQPSFEHEELRQGVVSAVAEKLFVTSFRADLLNELQRELDRAEREQAQARLRLDAAEAIKKQYEDALREAEPSLSLERPSQQSNDEDLVSIDTGIEQALQATFIALARVNGYGAALQELSNFDLSVNRRDDFLAAIQMHLRDEFLRREADEIAERLYALNIVGITDVLQEYRALPAEEWTDATSIAGSDPLIDWIVGANVQEKSGDFLGSIDSVIVDKSTGEIEAAIIGVGGFLGIGEKQIALPWEDLKINPDTYEIVGNLTRQEADAAPVYVFRDLADTVVVGLDGPVNPSPVEPASVESYPGTDAGEDTDTASADSMYDDSVAISDADNDITEVDPTALMPELFPWPPPEASARALINRSLFAPNSPQNLGEVADVLQQALADAGYTGPGYLGVPGGFAMITRIEQYDSNGRPLSGDSRWATRIVVVKSFSITGIMRALMTAEPGFFRVLVLVVTDKPFSDSKPRDRLEVLERWSRQGLDALVPVVKDMPFTEDYKVTALIYEFEKRSEGEDPLVRVPGRSEVPGHLAHTRFSRFLQ